MRKNNVLAAIWLIGAVGLGMRAMDLLVLLFKSGPSAVDPSLRGDPGVLLYAAATVLITILGLVEAALWARGSLATRSLRVGAWVVAALVCFVFLVMAVSMHNFSYSAWGPGMLMIAAVWSYSLSRGPDKSSSHA